MFETELEALDRVAATLQLHGVPVLVNHLQRGLTIESGELLILENRFEKTIDFEWEGGDPNVIDVEARVIPEPLKQLPP